VAEQLNVYQQDLRQKNATMKRMASELNMTSTTISEQKYEVERLSREVQDAKKKYFELKMANQTLMLERASTMGGVPGGGNSSGKGQQFRHTA
jgi:chromosome segregation ATPase